MSKYIIIDSIGSVSALGGNKERVLHSIREGLCHSTLLEVNNLSFPVMPIHEEAENDLNELLKKHPKYKRSDRTSQFAVLAAEKCFHQLQAGSDQEWVINAGSSRGATGIWETFHQDFIEQNKVSVKSSPLTTLGNISTHIAQHQKLKGFQIDHSITCSSGLQAMANGYAWLKAGLTNHFLAVGTEAPITKFTIAQMNALGIYSAEQDEFPCKPCALQNEPKNTFVLGEAAVAIALVNHDSTKAGDISIAGMGTGSEVITNPTAISPYGDAFRLSMLKALENAGMQVNDIDILIPHSPGTYQGDKAEYHAIRSVFGERPIQVFNHKFLTGHTLGASGTLSVELGYYLLTEKMSVHFPYPSMYDPIQISEPTTVLINSMGFGGNAVTIILKRL